MITSLLLHSVLAGFTEESCYRYPPCADTGNGLFTLVRQPSSRAKNETEMLLVPCSGFSCLEVPWLSIDFIPIMLSFFEAYLMFLSEFAISRHGALVIDP